MAVRDIPRKAIAITLVIVAALLYLIPKIRIHPLSAGITNNNWNGRIVYRWPDGSIGAECDFISMDSTPYWEGQDQMDEPICQGLPVYLHQGVPPLTIRKIVDGRQVELRAPLLAGRLL